MKRTLFNNYKNIRKILPDNINGQLGKISYIIRKRPIVKTDSINPELKFPGKEKGGLIISADFEMAWAWRFTKTGADYIKKGKMERENFPHIIKIFEDYKIPITFATVGHLFLEKCDIGEHDWMERIPHFNAHWKFTEGDWYKHDPYSNYIQAPEWYAPDLIQMILNSNVNHEIGCHTFSHIDFSYKNCPDGVADNEIKACIDAAKKYNTDVKSMVFPGGTWGNIEVLKKYNFTIYRKKSDFELAYPFRDEYGLLVTTSSGGFEYNINLGWSADYYVRRLKKIIQKALESNTIAHFWFHPSLEPVILKNVFPPVVNYASELRDKGLLWIGTMNGIAEHINDKKIY
jgi:peptidoglycan/xylan/chitin deacetylase (PgdA/CDA1 family)